MDVGRCAHHLPPPHAAHALAYPLPLLHTHTARARHPLCPAHAHTLLRRTRLLTLRTHLFRFYADARTHARVHSTLYTTPIRGGIACSFSTGVSSARLCSCLHSSWIRGRRRWRRKGRVNSGRRQIFCWSGGVDKCVALLLLYRTTSCVMLYPLPLPESLLSSVVGCALICTSTMLLQFDLLVHVPFTNSSSLFGTVVASLL